MTGYCDAIHHVHWVKWNEMWRVNEPNNQNKKMKELQVIVYLELAEIHFFPLLSYQSLEVGCARISFGNVHWPKIWKNVHEEPSSSLYRSITMMTNHLWLIVSAISFRIDFFVLFLPSYKAKGNVFGQTFAVLYICEVEKNCQSQSRRINFNEKNIREREYTMWGGRGIKEKREEKNKIK